MRKENLFRNKATKSLVAALAVAMATAIVPVSADAAKTTNVTIAKGDSKKLASGLTNAKSSKSSVATVTKTGKVTAKKAGEAKVTATKKGKKVTYKVAVKKAPTISTKSVSVKAGKSKTVTVDKNGAKYLTVSFKSSNTKVANVNKNGKITGVKKGTAVVTATVKGYNKDYKLKVDVKVTKAAAENTDEPTTPGTDEPTTPGTDEPTTPGTDEPTTPGTDEPTTPDETTGGAIDTTTGGAVDTEKPVDPVAPVTPVTPGNTWSPEKAAPVEANVYGNTNEITLTAGTETIKVEKSDLMTYLQDKDATELAITLNGASEKIMVPVGNAEKKEQYTSEDGVAKVDTSFSIGYAYTYNVTVKGNFRNAAKITVTVATRNSSQKVPAVTLTTDTRVVASETKELKSKDTNNVVLTYGDDTVAISKEQIRSIYKNGALTGEKVMEATVNTKTEKFEITTAKAVLDNNALIAATYYLPDSNDLLVLSISDVKEDSSLGNSATVTVKVISAGTAKTLKVEVNK